MIIGHTKILNFLDRSIEKDKISHAYIFSGQKHLGKFSVALDFAKKITGGEDKKINPDIIIIKPETEEKDGKVKEKEINIEKIRELEYQLNLSAYFGKYKVAIIDDADRLTVSAQNSLLKTLEEPQEKCVLILICHNMEKILPTIKSRCLIKRFNLVGEREMNSLITSEENKKDLAFWSFGQPGTIIALQKEKNALAERKESIVNLKNMLNFSVGEKFEFCDLLSKNSSDAIAQLNFWTIILRSNIVNKEVIVDIPSEKALEIIEEIQKSIGFIKETNSNLKSILENLVLKF